MRQSKHLEMEEKRLEMLLKEALETGDYDVYIIDAERVKFVAVSEDRVSVRK